MYQHTRRPSQNEEEARQGGRFEYCHSARSPAKRYSQAYGNAFNATPSKRRLHFDEAKENIDNYSNARQNAEIYEKYSRSPLKQSLKTYEINYHQPGINRNRKGDPEQHTANFGARYDDAVNRRRQSRVEDEPQPIPQYEPYRPTREHFSAKKSNAYNCQNSERKYSSFKRDQLTQNTINEDSRPIWKESSGSKIGLKLQNKVQGILTEEIASSRTPRKTGMKSSNPIIQKSELVKQKIEKLNRMTPRRSYLKEESYFVDQENFQENKKVISKSPLFQKNYDEDPKSGFDSQFEDQGKPGEDYQRIGDTAPSETLYKPVQQSESLNNIAMMGRQISARLKSIIQRHG